MLALQSGVNTSSKIRDLTRWGQTPPHVSASGIGICVRKTHFLCFLDKKKQTLEGHTTPENLTLISQIGRVFDRKSQQVCFSGKEGAVKEWRAELRAAAMFLRGVKV